MRTLLALILACSLCGCPENGAADTQKETKELKVLTVDAAGARYDFPADSPLAGGSLLIPKDAVEEPLEIRIGYTHARVKIAAGKWAGISVVLQADIEKFNQPLELAVPVKLDTPEAFAIPYRVEPGNELYVANSLGIDKQKSLLTISTLVPGQYTWVYP